MDNKKKVLVVDDEPDILNILAFRLKRLGHEVLTAANGQEALDKIRTQKPDIVFLDLILPDISGIDVCKTVKADEGLKHIPIVMVSASSTPAVIQEATSAGAGAYVVKPFEPAEILAKFKEFTA